MATRYRKFGRADIAAAHRLSAKVGWPHRVEDWRFVHGLATGHVAVEAKDVVGTILTWKLDRRYATLGMVIVDPARQGEGLGRRLMRLGLRDLVGRSVLLNSTRQGQPLYEKMGFRAIDTVAQHQGLANAVPEVPLAPGERLRPMGASDGPRLGALAGRAAGFSRARMLRHLLQVGEAIVLAHDDEILGFSVLRRFGRGSVIGPVVAPDPDRARALVSHWVGLNVGKFLRIDVVASAGLGPWLESIGLAQVDTVVTMVKGVPPAPDAEVKTYALVNQSLG